MHPTYGALLLKLCHWVDATKKHYEQFLGDKKERLVGKPLLTKENSGNLNIAPVMSPNGKYVIYLSEKNLFSVDLFLADALTGKRLMYQKKR